MTDSEITLKVLIEIRDSIRTLDSNLSTRIDATNTRIDAMSDRIDAMSDRIDARFEQVDRRFEVIEGALENVGTQLVWIGRYLKNRVDVEIEDLKLRVTKLEAKGT